MPLVQLPQPIGQSELMRQIFPQLDTHLPLSHVAQSPAQLPFVVHVWPHAQGWHFPAMHEPQPLVPQNEAVVQLAWHPAAHMPLMHWLQYVSVHCASVAQAALQVPAELHLPFKHKGHASGLQSEFAWHTEPH